MKVSNDPASELITYSLGSCIGIGIYDPAVYVGGLLHFMLPDSELDAAKAKKNPCMFADTGITALFKESCDIGAMKSRMRVIVVGGAQFLGQEGLFNIGQKNYMAVRKMFLKEEVLADYEDVGGSVNRTIRLEIETGTFWLKVSGQNYRKI